MFTWSASQRAKANVPRPSNALPLADLDRDPYHRYVREAVTPSSSSSSHSSSFPRERPYRGHTASFSVPRRSPGYFPTPSYPTEGPSLSSNPANNSNNNEAAGVSRTYTPPPLDAFASPRKLPEFTVEPAVRLYQREAALRRSMTAATGSSTEASSKRSRSPTSEKTNREPPPRPPIPWRPHYLHRRVLLSFCVVFAVLIAVVQLLLLLSTRHDGLATPGVASRYTWQYGGTAIITLVLVLWSRVEYQAKVSAPWIRLLEGAASAEQSLLLDYVADFQPVALVRALRYGDFLVASVAALSLLLRVLVVLSTVMIAPSFMRVTDPSARLTLESRFADDASLLQGALSMPFYAMAGLTLNNLTNPDGTSTSFAYQRFSADDAPLSTRLEAVVDGFTGSMDCEPAELVGLSGLEMYYDYLVWSNITLSTPGCRVSLRFGAQDLMPKGREGDFVISSFQAGNCTGPDSDDSGDNMKIAVFGAEILVDPEAWPTAPTSGPDPFEYRTGRTAQMLCTPRYAITPVRVAKNGTSLLSVEEIDSEDRHVMDGLSGGDVARAFFRSNENWPMQPYGKPQDFIPEGTILSVDNAMLGALRYRMNDTAPPGVEELTDGAYLEGVAGEYYTQYTALIARSAMMESTSVDGAGLSTVFRERLVVRVVPAHVISGILALCLLLCAAAIFLVPREGILPHAPNSIISVATLLAHSKPLLQTLRGTGGASKTELLNRLTSTYSTEIEPYERATGSGLGYFKISSATPPSDHPPIPESQKHWGHPFPLNPISRVAGILLLASIITALELLLRKSAAEGGVASVREGQLIWTTAVPALVLGLTAFYYAAADTSTRSLAPYAALQKGASFRSSVALDFLDKSAPRIVYSAFRMRNFAVLASTLTVAIGATLTIFSNFLYIPQVPTMEGEISISTVDFFDGGPRGGMIPDGQGSTLTPTREMLTATLLLGANLSYPASTYEDLAFQKLSLGTESESLSPFRGEDGGFDDLVLNLTMPALRPRMTCRAYPRPQIALNLTLEGYTILSTDSLNGTVHPLQICIAEEGCSAPTEDQSNIVFSVVNASDTTRFGMASAREVNAGGRRSHLSDRLYVWGVLEGEDDDTRVTSISALACNETSEVVDTKVTLYTAALFINPRDPPIPDESTAREASMYLSELDYNLLPEGPTETLLDPFFALLTTSRYAVPMASLDSEDEDAMKLVEEGISKQHRILRTQISHAHTRRTLQDGEFPAVRAVDPEGEADSADTPITSAFDPSLTPSEAQPALTASAHSHTTAHTLRLLQDPTSTRILQALLSTMLLLSIITWLLSRPPRLPCSPLSIASVGSLLADGNIFGFLPRGAEWMTQKEIESAFLDGRESMGFRISWEAVRRRRGREGRGRAGSLYAGSMRGRGDAESGDGERAFAIRVVRTGGWGGGVDAGLGILARVAKGHRAFVKGWRE